jgi:AcrR family transcriptional regulator
MLRAALKLFNAAGYEATTVRQIADAAEVSERTFFRYFAGKEDLVLSYVIGATELFRTELRARPANEKPMDAMRRALYGAMAWVSSEQDKSEHEFVYGSVVRLIEHTPALLAAHLREIQECGDQVARLLAEREGIGADDPRPPMLVSVFAALVLLANREWQGAGGIDALLALADTYLDGLPALHERWNSGD